MEESITTQSAEATRALGQKLASEIVPGTLICLTGDLGAGKTTFTQGVLEALGAVKPYISPTFVIMKEYALPTPSRAGVRRVYHADAYRVTEKDFRNLGFEEWYTDPEGIVLLEWPERVASLLPARAWQVRFLWRSPAEREIRIQKQPA